MIERIATGSFIRLVTFAKVGFPELMNDPDHRRYAVKLILKIQCNMNASEVVKCAYTRRSLAWLMVDRGLTKVRPVSPRPYMYGLPILEEGSLIEDLTEALERARGAA